MDHQAAPSMHAAPSMTAAQRFAILPEMILALAEHVVDAKDLGNLRLVNYAFSQMVSVVQFREFSVTSIGDRGDTCLDDDDASLKKLGYDRITHRITRLVGALWLKHIRTLAVTRGDLEPDERALRDMLAGMPCLRKFHWQDGLLATETLRTLQGSCPNLRSLSIRFPYDMGMDLGMVRADRSHRSHRTHSLRRPETNLLCYGSPNDELSAFGNLQHLSLHRICGDFIKWRTDIAKILERSPGLKGLSLSLNEWVMTEQRRSTQQMAVTGFKDFLAGVCTEYGETGASPLRLLSVQFGLGIIPPTADILDQMMDVEVLEEVRISNISMIYKEISGYQPVWNLYFDQHDQSLIHLAGFSSSRCPNLRRMIFDNYDQNIKDFLTAAGPALTRRLGVFGYAPWAPLGGPTSSISSLVGVNPKASVGAVDPDSDAEDDGHSTAGSSSDSANNRPSDSDPCSRIAFRMLELTITFTEYGAGPCDNLREALQKLVRYDYGAIEGLGIYMMEWRKDEICFGRSSPMFRELPKLQNLRQLQIHDWVRFDTFRVRRLESGRAELVLVTDRKEIEELELFSAMEENPS
ncbi:hypothetical protein QBC34DRAFT_498981 [Podospora aff. communis PSN243]|uniref:F-box domain-containing protein n=1 Tax=Podospora aff. communis PSN243 TaxID=3040156 RepID=A0AAV9G7F5_9PEZI|nr:hypothetical protein QBC34DRAFT_498981 [Podospora aff. communis PSN243]